MPAADSLLASVAVRSCAPASQAVQQEGHVVRVVESGVRGWIAGQQRGDLPVRP